MEYRQDNADKKLGAQRDMPWVTPGLSRDDSNPVGMGCMKAPGRLKGGFTRDKKLTLGNFSWIGP